jgi:predicted PurR-regulated permease PerM
MASASAARVFLIVLAVLAVVLVAAVVQPFAEALFLAAVIAGALLPWMERLTARFRGRRNLAGAILTFAVLMVVVLPIAAFAATVVSQIVDGVEWLNEQLRSEGIAGLVKYLPRGVRPAAREVARTIPRNVNEVQDLAAAAKPQAGNAASAAVSTVGDVISYTGNALVQTGMMLIALFFLLVDGPKLVEWLNSAMPLKRGQFPELLEEFRKVAVAVLLSTIATAALQTVVAIVGYLIAGVPNAVFFGFITFIFALIPAIGAASVVVVTGLMKLVAGETGWAIFLLLWGVVLVGLVDNVAKPWLIRGGVPIHGGVIFFGLIGGLAIFGPIGLIAGPLAIAFLVAVVRMYQRDFTTQP